jgi:hypothetical protein
LNAPNSDVIGANRENRRATGSAKFRYVLRVAVQNYPTDSASGGSARCLRQRCRSQRLKKYGVRALAFVGLDGLQDLIALLDGIVIRVHYLESDA